MRIKIEYVCPPIPDRSCDYCAYDDDTYDGPGSPIGYGPTPELATEDLLSRIADRK